MVVNIAVGMITPPVASCLFVASQVCGLKSIGKMCVSLVPYLIAMIILTLLFTYIPEISLLLPRFFGMNL